MSKTSLSIAILLVLTFAGATARGEEAATGGAAEMATLDSLLDAIQSNRKALVAANLQLTDDEATKFWPVYDRYQKEIGGVGERLAGLVKDYAAGFPDFSDEKAMKIVNDYLAIESDRVAVRRTYVPEFAKTLPGRKLARLYQIENKMDAVIRYDLASTIPVMEE
jgi:hypothetical protein